MAIARQGITIYKNGKYAGIDDLPTDSDLLILVKKTGYYNFWINGEHYYCDERTDTSKITNAVLIYAFNGGKSAEDKKKKKGKIVISKK